MASPFLVKGLGLAAEVRAVDHADSKQIEVEVREPADGIHVVPHHVGTCEPVRHTGIGEVLQTELRVVLDSGQECRAADAKREAAAWVVRTSKNTTIYVLIAEAES